MVCTTVIIKKKPAGVPNIVVTDINVIINGTTVKANETRTIETTKDKVTAQVIATVENIGNAKGSKNIHLKVNGVTKAGVFVTLNPNETTTEKWTLTLSSSEVGERYDICVE